MPFNQYTGLSVIHIYIQLSHHLFQTVWRTLKRTSIPSTSRILEMVDKEGLPFPLSMSWMFNHPFFTRNNSHSELNRPCHKPRSMNVNWIKSVASSQWIYKMLSVQSLLEAPGRHIDVKILHLGPWVFQSYPTSVGIDTICGWKHFVKSWPCVRNFSFPCPEPNVLTFLVHQKCISCTNGASQYIWYKKGPSLSQLIPVIIYKPEST